jgi:hypothetical protein
MRLAAIAAAIILALIVSSVSALPAGRQVSTTVSVVYFVPSDQQPNDYPADLIMADVQGWYGVQVGSTFDVGSVQVVKGRKTAAEYQDNIWGDILRELGYYCGTGVHVIIVHQSISFVGGGSCDPDYQSSSAGGTAMIAEEFFPDNRPSVVAHEMGHAFALPHSTCDSLMGCPWLYPNVGLLDVEIAALQASPYFDDGDDPPKTCKPFKGRGKALGRCRA